ncbi:MAG TPA: hypothetical protein EYG30_10430 [Planctomycetes bacterium]|nr:hypothetical protein [Planctomycetota bacterium]HIL52654.1 hypothetical protein [Planctomycetota bacterium]
MLPWNAPGPIWPAAPLKKILAQLNPDQLRAVTAIEGAVLVLAGAGSGKTRVITVRIAHLCASGVKPEAVLAMTFTNRAAKEMRERVAELVGKQRAERLTVGTFHAFCLGLLRENAALLGYPAGISIADASDQLAACKSVLRELHIAETSIKPAALQAGISLFKNKLMTPEDVSRQPGDNFDELVSRGYARYEEFLKRSRKMDFDDLLLFTVRLFEDHPGVLEALQTRYRYIMVDEFQDTNGPQAKIVDHIVAKHGNVCVVGDDDQSIYSWRGADISKILSFETTYPQAVVVRLETNYRSTQDILDAANRVIENNPKRHEKTLRSHAGHGEPIQLVVHRDEMVEAEFVVRDICMRVEDHKNRLSDFAVLFRTAIQPRSFEAELRARGVPYVLVGGMSFFDRKEVRDVLAYLKVIHNPEDEVSLLRIINCPPRGIGKSTLDRVLAFAVEQGIGVPEAFGRASEIIGAAPRAVEAVQRLQERLAAFKNGDAGGHLVSLVERVLETFAYRDEVQRCYPDARERDARWLAVTEILNFAENHSRRCKRPSLGTFLQELTLSANDDRSGEDAGKKDAVTLMTLHSAKGLEFNRVFLVGLEEGILPHARSLAEDNIEEERRLMYVGITRARNGLTVSYTTERAKYGTRVAVQPSRFLFEMRGTAPPDDWVAADGAPSASDKPRRGGRSKRKGKAPRKPSTAKRARKKARKKATPK